MKKETEIKSDLPAMNVISGFHVRPGFFDMNGATALAQGVNFTIHSHQATSCSLVLFHHRETKPFAVLKYPETYRIGHTFSMLVYGLDIHDIEYAYTLDGPNDPKKGLLFDKTKYILDPYARAVAGQSVWGKKFDDIDFYKARVVRNDFDWGAAKQPLIPMEDTIIYELHVRNFTMHPSSKTEYPGTFAAIKEKLPYLLELGINCVELMPIFEFNEMLNRRELNGHELLECWGYNTVSFFAPNTCYLAEREYNHEGHELKETIKLLNDNGIEVILDVVFNHTGEGNEFGPFFSFKGVDNNIYYMLTPDGYYYNFSGCGNTLNCNHPIVQQMILECLRYWVVNYRVDGFRFDLASILGRNEDGSPMSKPPLLQSLAFDPILGDVKLIAEAWDAGGLYQVGSFPSWNRWAEWNGKYRDDMRQFLKGDDGKAQAAALRLTGSADLYPEETRGRNASVNFVSCHDGFTLYDLYAYNQKHNEQNGWNNEDGDNNGNSWNCGEEGETQNLDIQKLRKRMIMNACVSLLCSRGTPMFYAGDEFGNSQFGNNNPYCQDNEISWLDWSLLEKNRELFEFFKFMIRFRKSHAVMRKNLSLCSFGFPFVSTHGKYPFTDNFSWESKQVGVMFAGRTKVKDDIVYAAFNTYWESEEIILPDLLGRGKWQLVADTYQNSVLKKRVLSDNRITMGPRSAIVLVYTANGQD